MNYLIHHMLSASSCRFPDKEALVDKGMRLSYANVAKQVAGFAEGLRQGGLRRGDRVGIYLETSVLQALCIFGISRAAGVFVPINSLLFPEQVAHIANDCQIRVLITTREKLAALAPILKGVPSLEFVVVTGEGPGAEVRQAIFELSELFGLADAQGNWRERGIEKDLAAILYTSGSTGKPKGVMLSHGQVMAGSSIVSDYLRITCDERIIGVLPLSFDAGLNQLMTAIQQGGTYVPMTFTFAREIVKTLEREQITGMAGVPTLWSLISQSNSTLAKTQLPHLRYITNTGGRMPQTVLADLRRLLPTTEIFLMYGLTEAFRSTYLPPEELDRRSDSMGKAIPDTEIMVVNEKGERCQPGEVGELVHRGPTVSLGYWGLPELTATVLRPHPFAPPELGDSEKVCYSGDLVRMDDEGYLYFIARRDNMIKCSGFRVSPTEVEEVLFQSGKVREVGVIGIPDPVLGQAIKAVVVPREDNTVSADELTAHCAAKLPRYMVPKTVIIRDSLPKTSSGKVDYPALRKSMVE